MIKNLVSLKNLFMAYAFGKKYPLTVSHIITTRCNLRCSYCDMWKHKEDEMNTSQIFQMLDEFSEMGMRRYGITGGEPLLRKDIGEVISYAKKKGLIVTLFTNGYFVKSRIDELKDLDVLITSFDGSKEVHEANRQEGAYDKVIEAIKIAREHGKVVWVGVTITKNNLNSIDFILEKSKELGFGMLFQPVYDYPGYSSDKAEDLQNFGYRYKKAIDKIIVAKKKGYLVLNSKKYLKLMKNPLNQKPNKPCWAGKTYCALTPGGRVSPCFKIYALEQWPSGVEMGFKKAFLSLPDKPKCYGCFSYATTESNLFYSLNLPVMWNTYRCLIKHEKNGK